MKWKDLSENERQQQCGRMVEQEVYACVSMLVGTLRHLDAFDTDIMQFFDAELEMSSYYEYDDLRDDLIRQARKEIAALTETLIDYEEGDDKDELQEKLDEQITALADLPRYDVDLENWIEDNEGIFDNLPDFESCRRDREIYEYWIVSDWLAEKLRARGEFVGDLCDLNVWGRTTSGQAILLDYVINQIRRSVYEYDSEVGD